MAAGLSGGWEPAFSSQSNSNWNLRLFKAFS
jgi:hypothetical protein